MAIDYSTGPMVAAVKRRCALPSVQPRFSDANIAQYADEEMRNILVPLIMSIVEEFFVTSVDFAVTPDAFTFRIPSKAIGNKLTDVTRLLDGSPQTEVTLVQLSPADLHRGYLVGYSYGQGYILRGNKIVIQPTPTGNFTLRVYFYRRPNQLVNVAQAAKIVTVNTVTGVVTCAAVPLAWAAGTLLDCIDGQPTFEPIFENVAILVKAGFDVTIPVASAVLLGSGTQSAGTYLSLTGEAVVPSQIPYEGHSLITEAAVMKIAESLGDTVLYKTSAESYKALKSAFLMAIAPRVDRSPKKAISPGGNCWDYSL